MARTVADTALLLSVQAGPFAPDPLTLPEAGAEFRADLRCDPRGLKIAFTPDLGLTPVEPQVAAACRNAASVFEQLGCSVVDDCPDLDGAMDVFQTQRAAQLALLGHRLDGAVANWREHAKDTALWNIDRGLQLSSEELLAAEVKRTALYARVAQFFERYDALLLPAAQVAPFDVNLDWVHEINGQPMATYLDWMTVCCAISITGLPALSVPCGYTLDGLPIGLQIVGKPRGDFALLKIAYAFEQATQSERRRPELNRIPANAP